MRLQRRVQERLFGVRISKFQRNLARLRCHLGPAFAEGVNYFFRCRFLRQFSELKFQKHQAERVFQRTTLEISREALFKI